VDKEAECQSEKAYDKLNGVSVEIYNRKGGCVAKMGDFKQ